MKPFRKKKNVGVSYITAVFQENLLLWCTYVLSGIVK